MTETATVPVQEEQGTPVLEARDVAVHFGGVKAVDGLSMTLRAGKIYGILGPNGSGKSTLLGAMTRLTQLTRGELLFDGEEYHKVPAAQVAKKRVARTFQTVRLLPDLTVRDNIQLGADARTAEGADSQGLLRTMFGRGALAGRRRCHRADQPGGVRGLLPLGAVLRHPAARRDRPGHRDEPAAAPPRRADRRHEPEGAGRDLPAAPEPAG